MKTIKHLLLLVTVVFAAFACKPKEQTPHPDWSYDSTIYEVNVRQYTEDGTFKSFQEHLPRLKELGVEILWFMPIQPIGIEERKGSLGSYYSIRDYTAINPEFGNMDDFKTLVNEAHKQGFKVIIDWVANHTSHDHRWTVEHPEFYKHDSVTGKIIAPFDWSDVAQLDWENEVLFDTMIREMKYWITNADIDGFRCDVAGMVPQRFWEKVRGELNPIKHVFMLAEDEGQRHFLDSAFDANYAWELHHIMNSIAKGEKTTDDLLTYKRKEDTATNPKAYRMTFTSNHDENSWNGTEFERMKDAVKTFAAFSFVYPGFPLIYNGQEVGMDKRLRFFDKDTILWNANEYTDLYKNLVKIKKEHSVLQNGEKGAPIAFIASQHGKVLAFTREDEKEKMLMVFNFSAENMEFKFTQAAFAGMYTNALSNEKLAVEENAVLRLKPWGYKIFVAKK